MSRIKHFYKNYQEAIHVAANRDELGMYDSKKHPFVFYKGYIFEGGRWLYNAINRNIKDGCKPFLGTDFHKTCIGFFDKKHKKVAVKEGNYYTYLIYSANPYVKDDNRNSVYHLDEIPVEDIFDKKNSLILSKERAKTLIKSWMYSNVEKYKVLHTRSKICRDYSYYVNNSLQIKKDLKELIKECPELPVDNSVDIFGIDKYFIYLTTDYYHIQIPTINEIINNTVFNEEQQKHIDMCKFYTKYCYKEDHSWKDVVENWNTSKLDIIKDIVLKRRERYKKWEQECVELTARNRREAMDNCMNNFTVDSWRKSSSTHPNEFQYEAYFMDKYHCKVSKMRTEYCFQSFKNVELKLDGKNVITSKNAVVGLEYAIKLFNWLYKKCISKNITFMDFTHDNIKISWYSLRHICYLEKHTDDGEKLGYSDWKIQIGCHSIWMEEVKEFCRYYHLEDKVDFDCKPLETKK